LQIRKYKPRDREAVVRLSLRAWAPVFPSIEQSLDPEVYRHFFPDWRECQQQAVEEVCQSKDATVWVGEEDGVVVGFTAIFFRTPTFGEIYMIAVDPAFQQRGHAAALTHFALDWMREQGVVVAMVETGADPGHAPARRTYERCGFRLSEVARYFKKL
jgi:ribosomal protein S18 acetylase RimI-like enzyme